MMIMEYEILPGPSLAELARTALARAAAATVNEAGRGNARPDVAGRVPVRTRPDGSPLLLAATGSVLEQRLTTCPEAVTVSVPAAVPFSSLRLTGTARAVARDTAARITACAVALRSVEFGGAVPGTVWNCSCSPRTAPWPSGCRSRTARSARSTRSRPPSAPC
jgi:hypothetical protein